MHRNLFFNSKKHLKLRVPVTRKFGSTCQFDPNFHIFGSAAPKTETSQYSPSKWAHFDTVLQQE